MNPAVQAIIHQIPTWRDAANIIVKPQKGGLTNVNYHVDVDGEAFILRINGENSAPLGISRETELQALQAASRAGIAPEIVLFTLPEGHLVTRFIKGREWGMDAFKKLGVIHRVAKVMKRVHALAPITGVFSPYRDIALRLDIAKNRTVTLPQRLESYLEKLQSIEKERDKYRLSTLCHNDPFYNNFIYNDRVYLLDWEFAGMGDAFFDLASVSYFFNADQKDYFLECYFGEVTRTAQQTLQKLWYVVAFWNATWALLQIGNPYSDFNYSAMVQNVFAKMAEML